MGVKKGDQTPVRRLCTKCKTIYTDLVLARCSFCNSKLPVTGVAFLDRILKLEAEIKEHESLYKDLLIEDKEKSSYHYEQSLLKKIKLKELKKKKYK